LLLQLSQDVVQLRFPPLLRIGDGEDQRSVLPLLFELVDDLPLLVGALVLQRGDIEEEFHAVQLHLKRAEQAVGLDVVEHVRLPEEHHVLVVGVHALVDVLMQRRMAEVNRAALAEIAAEEGIEFVEEFFAEFRKRHEGRVNVVLQPGEDAVLVVARLDTHQVDITRFAFDLCPDKNVSEGVVELLLFCHRFAALPCG